ncbi:hypothetical protein EV363DRAFT_1350301 [Boletus edulis]|nr:hypothetical protein EV363DRAFT_1350301 [Boletus edulis]
MYGTSVDYTFNSIPVQCYVTTDDQGPCTANSDYAPSTEPYMRRCPSNTIAWSPTFQSELEREMEALYGTENNDKAVDAQIPSDVAPTDPFVYIRRILSPGEARDPDTSEGSYVTGALHTHSPASICCRWTGSGNTEGCGTQITRENVPAHFQRFHGIRKMKQDVLVCCQWEGCHKRLRRKNFVRHIREHHMGHPRRKKCLSGN